MSKAPGIAVSHEVVLYVPPDASGPEHLSFHPSSVSGNEWQTLISSIGSSASVNTGPLLASVLR